MTELEVRQSLLKVQALFIENPEDGHIAEDCFLEGWIRRLAGAESLDEVKIQAALVAEHLGVYRVHWYS